MNLKEALNVISDNQISIMTWGSMLLPPINHRLKILDIEVTLETTGTEAIDMIDKLPDAEKSILYSLEVDLDNMYVGRPTPTEVKKKDNYHVYSIAIAVSVVVVVMVALDVIYNKSTISGDNLSVIIIEILKFIGESTSN